MNYSISAFFPTYNEEGNIEKTIRKAVEVIGSMTDIYEIIVVNDGSTDKTPDIVRYMSHTNDRIRLINHDKNKGYGEALKSGIKAAKHDYIFFADADLQFDLTEVNFLLGQINEYDAVIGYRKDRHDGLIRSLNAKLWNVANRVVFGLNMRDIDCGFKLFKKDCIKNIQLNSSGAMISTEILFKLKNNGYSIKEVPVTHMPRVKGEQTGAKPAVILKALKEMMGFYRKEVKNKS